ncbi:MAG: hypothetical protein K2G14_00320 [Ruminococcus sp.]|nr:hypothetical protein [Ruminococcus sp.]
MLYSSLLFIYGFLPVSLLIYMITPENLKKNVLFLLSMIFCTLNSLKFLVFMLVYIAVNYIAGMFIWVLREKKSLSAIPLFVGTAFDLTMIFMFRTEAFSSLKNNLNIPDEFFPVGISFFTLSAVGYLIDIFRKRMRAERDFICFGLYIMMFPRIIMGPVIRYKTFKKMLKNRKSDLADIGMGFTIFVKGLVKKVIAADTMYMLYTAVKSVDIWKMPALNAWLGMTAYLLCLYFMLSGFADMGTGVGYCFGFRFPQSFNYPVFSTKIRNFAANWHVHIIYWFRRYFSKPLCELCRKRVYKKIIYILAWCMVGFWYRFDINGFLWGFFIGLSVLAENVFGRMKIMKATGIIYTYAVTMICAVFLAGENISYSLNYLLAMLGGNRMFADSQTLYLLKYYIVLLLICMYFSTSLFRNMLMRSGRTKLKVPMEIASPIITVVLLAVCTALISYSGSSGMILMTL